MKLLLDENLSDSIIPQIIDLYPASTHIKILSMLQSDDAFIWEYARANDFAIVSKDADFHQRSLLYGHSPKFIYLRIGNCPTTMIVELLRKNYATILQFEIAK